MVMSYFATGNLTAFFSTWNGPLLLLGGDHQSTSSLDADSSLTQSLRRTCSPGGDGNGCSPGLILPVWLPTIARGDTATTVFRAVVYIIALGYMLFGINVITDRILSAIEVIVSQKRTVVVKTKSGESHTVEVPCWHHVVATLTVYCIGTSTPEIFLPTIEVIKRHFQADELGPAVVVGSGAYHLFLITGVCLASVREQAGKPIRDLHVFFVTAAYAIFAYLLLWILVAQISPGVIEPWEGLVMLLLFPAIVVSAWFVERRFPRRIYLKIMAMLKCKKRRQSTENGDEQPPEDIGEFDNGAMLAGIHEQRRRLAQILQRLKTQYPDKTRAELEEFAEMQLLEEMPKDAAFYRMQAGKAISGGGNIISKEKIKEKLREEFQRKNSFQVITTDPNTQLVSFDSPRYTCMESCGQTILTVTRTGPGISETVLTVDYEAFEGTAKFEEDFLPTKGKLTFFPGQTTADVAVTIIDDDEFEEDKEFLVKLSRPTLKISRSCVQSLVVPSQATIEATSQKAELGPTCEATVCILDDDHCGVFGFETQESAIADNVGTAKIKVVRSTGARGRVAVPYKVTPGSAKPNDDYIVPETNYGHSIYNKQERNVPMIVFENDQFEANIEIVIIDKNRIGEVATFYIELLEPEIQSSPPKNPLGNPILGTPKSIKLGICEDAELKEALDRLLKMADISHLVGTTSWRGQFREALTINFDSSGDDEDLSIKTCSWFRYTSAYIVFALSLPWRLITAALPPSYFLHGWVAFISLLGLLGLMAALTGDLAQAFGCTVGLKDSVTAVTLIAFGMGLPDTFASRHAAISEKTADAAIGHITGSNAVSVFLGIGLSWTLASFYHAYHNRPFLVPPGSLGLSVTLYCAFATAGILALLLRRIPPIGGELGGPLAIRAVSAVFFFCLWFAFVTMSVLENYCIITGF